MAGTADRTSPQLWDKVKQDVTKRDKGGKPGQWSARKAQMAVQEYKAEGGGYKGPKSSDNHLSEWTREEWGTKSGQKSGETGERYLPKKAREKLSDGDYQRSTAKKRVDTKAGKQFSAQPRDVAKKTAKYRGGVTKQALMQQAAKQGIKGRSRMNKGELERALHEAG